MNAQTQKSKAELADLLNKYEARLKDQAQAMAALQARHSALQERFEAHRQTGATGFARDVREEALHLAQLIVDASPVILYRREAAAGHKMVYVSDNMERFGYSPEEFLIGSLALEDIIYAEDINRIVEEVRTYATSGTEAYTQIYRIMTKKGDIRWVEDQTRVVYDAKFNKKYNQGLMLDITPRKLALEQLRKSEEKYRRIVETAGEGFVLMDEKFVIIDLNQAYCHLTGYGRDELVGRRPGDVLDPNLKDMLFDYERILALDRREHEAVIVTKDGREVPVWIHGNILRDDKDNVIGNMAFVTDMTVHKKALDLAAEVQKSLLPQTKPGLPGFDIEGRNLTCDEVGGDYYDLLWDRDQPRKPFSVVVGDIAGHGVESALIMTTARAFLRMRASQPGTVAETDKFMTLFYLRIDSVAHQLAWVRAGHDPALVFHPLTDTFEALEGPGMVLGVDENYVFKTNRQKGLAAGDIIAIGTDGIWEACNRAGEMYGKTRFKDVIREKAEKDAADIVNGVFDDLKQFTFGQAYEDDITLVIIKVTAEYATLFPKA